MVAQRPHCIRHVRRSVSTARGIWGMLLLTSLILVLAPMSGGVRIPPHSAKGRGGVKRAPGDTGAVRKLTFGEEMVAGACARAAAQWIMFPADAMKTLRQARTSPGTVVKIPPVRDLLKGATATSLMALPAGAIQFSVFPAAKQVLKGGVPGMSMLVCELLASSAASVCACFVQTPQEVLKQRVQTGIYKSVRSGAAQAIREGGIAGLYTGFGPTVARNMPMVCFTFTAFSRLKAAFKARTGKEASGLSSFALGGFAACVACILTQPIDVVKTRLMTQALSNLTPYKGVGDCVSRMLREEGAGAFFKGLAPRMIYVAPFAAVQFTAHAAASKVVRACRRQDHES
mmetsp:Transcript_23888/g.55559  ORF Transcript_23888/g.55559 Transcript_23888/m.55559 type:complete len:344 (+) Transcript_23888:170-1201(+)